MAPFDDFNAGGTLPTTPMDPRFMGDRATGKLGEDQPGNQMWPGQAVTYLRTPEQRAQYKLEVRDYRDPHTGATEKRLFDADGKLFDTRTADTFWTNVSGVRRAIFVMNAKGELFARNYQARGEFHHSSLAAGHSVAAAGEIQVIEGKIVDISNNSGHYRPTDEFTVRAVRTLQAQGMALTGVKVIEILGPGKQRARVVQ